MDEINLASQSVLEGLNACFDHRSEIFISELGRTFTVRKDRTKIFACQNPYWQGGGRKGLPKSFLNRFAIVHMDPLNHSDLLQISTRLYPQLADYLPAMIRFNECIHREVCVEAKWATLGSPWEFNLRDLFRWCDLIMKCAQHPKKFVYLVYAARLRSSDDRKRLFDRFREVFGCKPYEQDNVELGLRFSSSHVQIGQSFLPYSPGRFNNRLGLKPNKYLALINYKKNCILSLH